MVSAVWDDHGRWLPAVRSIELVVRNFAEVVQCLSFQFLLVDS